MCLMNPSIYLQVSTFLTIIVILSYAKAVPPMKRINTIVPSRDVQMSGLQQLKILRHLIKDCENSSWNTSSTAAVAATTKTWQCLKVTSLNLLDDVTSRDIVPVYRGVRFVRTLETSPNNIWNAGELYDSDFWKRKDLQHLTWFDRLALSFTRLLWTHKLEINLKELTDAYMERGRDKDNISNSTSSDTVGTARHRRHRFNMMVTMIFGVTALGAVLVPMGFQLLSVVSGKALLLAKMALLLASINGLKRVANTGLHYGLYHVPGEHYGGLYDRGDVHHPRNVHSMAGHEQPIELALSVK